MTRALNTIPLKEVSDAALAEVNAQVWAYQDEQFYAAVARRLGSGLNNPGGDYGWDQTSNRQKFIDCIRRSLVKHAENGAIRRAGRFEPGPGGTYDLDHHVRVWSHDGYKAAAERVAERNRADDELREAWIDVRKRLARYDIRMDDSHRLDLDSWQRLLDITEGAISASQ